jgi:hypothetical protein
MVGWTEFLRFRSRGRQTGPLSKSFVSGLFYGLYATKLLIVIYLSFFDKKSLTNTIYGFILCAMNVNEISPNANPRLSRIKKLSRSLKVVFLFYFVVLGLVLIVSHGQIAVKMPIQVGGQNFSSLREIPAVLKTYEAICFCLYLLAVIAFYRLLNLYEKGIIFSAENVSQIRRLGQLAVFYGVLSACLPVFETPYVKFPLTLPLNILCSPGFMVGCLTIIIAWVMDEGRKIQEEQELTV